MLNKMILILIFILICQVALSPGLRCFYIVREEGLNEYERLFKAVCFIESSNRAYIINEKENAWGIAQIRPCRLKEYNDLTNKHYLLSDCLNPEVAKEIFYFYAQGKSYEQAARNWNGAWNYTEIYWLKVKKYL